MSKVVNTLAVLSLLGGCGEPVKTAEELAAETCPKVHLDRMGGDWVLLNGKVADPKTRLRVIEDDDGYRAYFVGGFFKKVELTGKKQKVDVVFTEVADDARLERLKQGGTLIRMYATPKYTSCSLQVDLGTVASLDGARETINPKPSTFIEMPPADRVFSYAPATETLFIGDAARDKRKADKEIEEYGGPSFEFAGNPVPVGVWTKAAADGDAGCTYDMDLFLDDELQKSLTNLPAGEVKDGMRYWFHEWDADYEGNHHFEIHRFKTCGGERERIGVSALEAVLM